MNKNHKHLYCTSVKSCFFSCSLVFPFLAAVWFLLLQRLMQSTATYPGLRIFVRRLGASPIGCGPLAALRSSVSQKGFTLLEVMIAMVILSIGLLGMAALTASVIRTNSFSNHFTTATTLSQDQLEQLINTGFSGLANGTTTQTGVDDNGTPNNGGIFTRQWTIALGATTANISVTVSWQSALGANKSVTLSGII